MSKKSDCLEEKYLDVRINFFKVSNEKAKTMCEICSKLIMKIQERPQLRLSGDFIVNFEQILHIVLVFPLLNLNKYMPASDSFYYGYRFQFQGIQ